MDSSGLVSDIDNDEADAGDHRQRRVQALSQSQSQSQGRGGNDGDRNGKLVEWVLSLPRLLWEIGTKDLLFVEVSVCALFSFSISFSIFLPSSSLLGMRHTQLHN